MTEKYKQRRKIGFATLIIIGLVIGLLIKRVAIGLVIGLVLGLMASGMVGKEREK